LRLLSTEVIYLILLSSVIAYPIAYFGSKYWLEGFASKINISVFVYLGATLIVLIVGWLSISYQTIKAASFNPARALRTE
jgi:putative ABC transport system permease protein